MELLAGLEPATFCCPKKMRNNSPSRQPPFFGGPFEFNPRSDESNPAHNSKTKGTPFGIPFVLELLAGLEPATC